MKYTVILARPEYVADSSAPVDTHRYWAVARDVPEAIVQAQHHVAAMDGCNEDEAGDYYPIAVFHGHLEELQ
jgi:sugar lactone lactonase YvrE